MNPDNLASVALFIRWAASHRLLNGEYGHHVDYLLFEEEDEPADEPPDLVERVGIPDVDALAPEIRALLGSAAKQPASTWVAAILGDSAPSSSEGAELADALDRQLASFRRSEVCDGPKPISGEELIERIEVLGGPASSACLSRLAAAVANAIARGGQGLAAFPGFFVARTYRRPSSSESRRVGVKLELDHAWQAAASRNTAYRPDIGRESPLIAGFEVADAPPRLAEIAATVSALLTHGHPVVDVPGIGTIERVRVGPRSGCNPRTGALIELPGLAPRDHLTPAIGLIELVNALIVGRPE